MVAAWNTITVNMFLSCIFLSMLVASVNAGVCRCDEENHAVICSRLGLSTFSEKYVTCKQPFWKVDLSQNSLRQYPDDVRDFKIVNLTRNSLANLKATTKQSVERLDVSVNIITDIDLKDLFPSLQHLYVSNNNLGFESANFFRGRCKLEHLVVSANKITSLQPIAKCERLVLLSAARNGISKLSDHLSTLVKLEVLDLSYNKLMLVSNLPSALKKLDLSFNEITRIGVSSFAGLSSLTELNLGVNKISEIDGGAFKSLTSLQHLKIERNRVKALTSQVFLGLKSLRVFGASYNEISSVAEDTFADLGALEVVNFNGNSLTKIPALRFGRNVTAVTFMLNLINKMDVDAVLAMLKGSAARRRVNFPLNPLRGDDPAWVELLRQFQGECLLSWLPMLDKVLKDGGVPARHRGQRLAPGGCPCARFSWGEWAVGACVAHAPAVQGVPWLRAAQLAAHPHANASADTDADADADATRRPTASPGPRDDL